MFVVELVGEKLELEVDVKGDKSEVGVEFV
jgi:hypothetical protein